MYIYTHTYEPLAKLVVFALLPKKVYITFGGIYCYTCLCTYKGRGTNLCEEKKRNRREQQNKRKRKGTARKSRKGRLGLGLLFKQMSIA